MKLLLLKDVRKLGHVGDVVDVTNGYGRNYLLPQRLAAEPTDANIAAIQEEKKRAAADRARRQKEFEALAASLADVSVTIEAAANEEGTLYGSVGPREIASALHALGHAVLAEHIVLDSPIRTLDNRVVKLQFNDDVSAQVKVGVVRTGAKDGEQPAETGNSRFEAEGS